jgi:hypothetical protein
MTFWVAGLPARGATLAVASDYLDLVAGMESSHYCLKSHRDSGFEDATMKLQT